ncbi:acyltransferase family protein [Leclercia adecarboxylata]|uniref:acyltransferase family protein n=1 Tax=Enterobacteriaceae TaxID=543 RepID=UPI00057B447F|nr:MULTISPECIES: acyltransferase family protein [Enterobacteriaceae]QCZ28602.1 acyltransferase [Leclercia adecarboxylata]TLU68796.1 acyltransferase [Enterobacter sp. MF024]
MNLSTIKPRYDWVDAMKFLGISAIYLGHLGTYAGKLYPFVFSFHVPLFFFAAGFFAAHKAKSNFVQFTINKARRLLLPYFAFAFMTLLITGLGSGSGIEGLKGSVIEIIFGIRNAPAVGSLWFINCLFTIFIIDFIFSRITTNPVVLLILSLIAYVLSQTVLGHNPLVDPKWIFNVDSALAYWWSLAAGRCLFSTLQNSKAFSKSVPGAVLFAVLGLITAYQLFNSGSLLLAVLQKIQPSLAGYAAVGMFNNIFTTLCLILTCVFVAKAICESKYVINVGKNTLNICGLEYIVKSLIPLFIGLLGLQFTIPNPLAAVIYTCICIYVAHKIGVWLSDIIRGPFLIK